MHRLTGKKVGYDSRRQVDNGSSRQADECDSTESNNTQLSSQQKAQTKIEVVVAVSFIRYI